MKPPLLTSRMIKVAGGSRWQKNGMDRIYFNNLAKKGGLEYDTYKSGNIASASLRGKGISNATAGEILGYLRDSKVFFYRGTIRMVIKPPYATGARQAQQRTAESMLRRAVAEIARDARMPVKKPRKKRG